MGWFASVLGAAKNIGTAAAGAAPAAAQAAAPAAQAAGQVAANVAPQIGHLGGQVAQGAQALQATPQLINAIGNPAGNSLLSGQGPMQTMHRGVDVGGQIAPGVEAPTNIVPQMPGGPGPVEQMPVGPGSSMAEAESFWGKTWEFLKTDTGVAMLDMVGGGVHNPPPSYGPMSYNQSRAQPNVGPGLMGLGQLSGSY